MQVLTCPYCKYPAQFVKGSKVYPHRPHLHDKDYYYCEPCDASVAAFKNGKPMGALADRALRKTRSRLRKRLDALWQFGGWTRSELNRKLAKNFQIPQSFCNIAMLNEDQCRQFHAMLKNWEHEAFSRKSPADQYREASQTSQLRSKQNG